MRMWELGRGGGGEEEEEEGVAMTDLVMVAVLTKHSMHAHIYLLAE